MLTQLKAVIDTSVLAGILTSPYYLENDLLQCWQLPALMPIACPKTIDEFVDTIQRVMRRRGIVPLSEIDQRIHAYLGWCQIVADPAANQWPSQCRDEDDQVFLDLAVAETAHLIIADDPDIRNIPPPHPVPIVGRGKAEAIARRAIRATQMATPRAPGNRNASVPPIL